MKQIFNVFKPLGKTPLQVVNELKRKYPEFEKEKIGYAGRLDPMADGVLLLLVGEENKKRKNYENLPKEYTAQILFGIETDTYDQLGIVTKISNPKSINKNTLKLVIKKFIGKHIQPYPPYSSQPVNGKPLFYWARQNKLTEIEIPTKEIEIYSLDLQSIEKTPMNLIIQQIQDNIAKVTGDFRQEEIRQTWTKYLTDNKNDFFSIVEIKISCSSGTYIRSIAHKLGQKLKTGAFALSIQRTKVGQYTINDSLKL